MPNSGCSRGLRKLVTDRRSAEELLSMLIARIINAREASERAHSRLIIQAVEIFCLRHGSLAQTMAVALIGANDVVKVPLVHHLHLRHCMRQSRWVSKIHQPSLNLSVEKSKMLLPSQFGALSARIVQVARSLVLEAGAIL